MNSLLNVEVSRFQNFNDVVPEQVNLLNWLMDDSCVRRQNYVQSIEDKSKRDCEKGKLPCITPSGTFTKRGVGNLIKHSGLIQVDVDLKGNEGVKNYSDLKKELCKIPNVAYCGLSVSRKGYWFIIAIAYPAKHKQHFEFIRRYFETKGLVIDKACSDVSRLRVYAYDPDAYFNHAAIPLQVFYETPLKKAKDYKQPFYESSNIPIYEQYNASNHYEEVLYKHGWQLDRKQGENIYYTRPGKSKGISASFNILKRTFYVFTDCSSFEPNRGYSAFAIYAFLEHNGDFKTATLCLSNKQKNKPFVPITLQKRLIKPTVATKFVTRQTKGSSDGIAEQRIAELASRLFSLDNTYTVDYIIELIQVTKNVIREQAQTDFNQMKEAGILEQTSDPRLYRLAKLLPFPQIKNSSVCTNLRSAVQTRLPNL